MNDEFLTRFREMPRSEFADALYERISQQSRPHLTQTMMRKLTFRNVISVFALLFLVAAGIRTVLKMRWNKVGEIWVDVRSTLKTPFTMETTLFRGVPYDAEAINLAEAETALGFEFRFPSWAPEGFILADQVSISHRSPKSLDAVWRSPDKEKPIHLFLQTRWHWYYPIEREPMIGPISTSPVAPGSFEEVQVQGRPAVLVRGDWNWPGQEVEGEIELDWDGQKGLSLYWTDGQVSYLLWTYHPAISADDLIKMAESAK